MVKISSILQRLRCLFGRHEWFEYSAPVKVIYRDGCCQHEAMDSGNCHDCYNTGHDHAPERSCDTTTRFVFRRCTECHTGLYAIE